MKWIKYIWILLIIYIACSARTCDEDEEATEQQQEQYTMNLLNSVKNVFTTDSLSDHLLRAFEITAIEKLMDFADYMKIISDTTLNLKFRQHAAELIKELFVNNDIDLYFWSKTYPESDLNNLELLLAHCLFEGIPCWNNPFQVSVSNPFVSINDSTYVGNLAFINKCVPINSNDIFEMISGELIIDIYLVKELKSFGKVQIRAWDVYLGDVR